MAGAVTHSWILYSAFKESVNGQHPIFDEIVNAHNNFLIKNPDYEYNSFLDKWMYERHLLPSCAYIGSCGPDLFYLETGKEAAFIADLLHYNRSGLFIIWWLYQIQKKIHLNEVLIGPKQKSFNPFTPQLKREFAYCLGHISHIAADIVIHPFVNSIVGAYPDLGEIFQNSNVHLLEDTGYARIWKFHNILEHYQDAYVWYELFNKEGGLKKHIEVNNSLEKDINFAYVAGSYFRRSDSEEYLQFVKQTRKFYRYTTNLDSIEKYKYAFFADKYSDTGTVSWWHPIEKAKRSAKGLVLNLPSYLTSTLPARNRFAMNSLLVNKDVFDSYLLDAIALTIKMWGEACKFISRDRQWVKENITEHVEEHEIPLQVINEFLELGCHWNLDNGIKILATKLEKKPRKVPGTAVEKLTLATGAELCFESQAKDTKGDVHFDEQALKLLREKALEDIKRKQELEAMKAEARRLPFNKL